MGSQKQAVRFMRRFFPSINSNIYPHVRPPLQPPLTNHRGDE